MKILILGLGRSGTTSLMRGLNEGISNSLCLFEIFNPNSNDYLQHNYVNYTNFLNNNTQPLIEKNLLSDIIYHIYNIDIFKSLNFNQLVQLQPNIFSFIINFYINHSKYFDKIILMSRKNLKESAQSWVNSEYYQDFHNPYKYNPNLDIKDKLYQLEFYQKVLESISLKLDIPITYYEDIYTGDKQDAYIFIKNNQIQINNFKNFYFYLNPKNRYRQN